MRKNSLIIGFCVCANCGTKRFEWNMIFKCPVCGCTEYVKYKLNEESGNESNKKGTT